MDAILLPSPPTAQSIFKTTANDLGQHMALLPRTCRHQALLEEICRWSACVRAANTQRLREMTETS